MKGWLLWILLAAITVSGFSVTNIYPENGSVINSSSVILACNATENLSKMTLFGDWSGWHADEILRLNGSNFAEFNITLANGDYRWYCLGENEGVKNASQVDSQLFIRAVELLVEEEELAAPPYRPIAIIIVGVLSVVAVVSTVGLLSPEKIQKESNQHRIMSIIRDIEIKKYKDIDKEYEELRAVYGSLGKKEKARCFQSVKKVIDRISG